MKKPAIGIALSHNTEDDDISLYPTYLGAVQVIMAISAVPPLEIAQEGSGQLVHMCDGFLFSGGPDPHPFLFGEEIQAHCGNAPVARGTTEPLLLKAVMAAEKPILRICRGTQIINVGLGGAIYQDIPSQTERSFPIAHKQPSPYPVPSHHVTALRDSSLTGIMAGQAGLAINSFYHQAVQTPASSLIISAYVPDGTIEAAKMQDHPHLLGTQWYPEHIWPKDRAAANISKSFAEACR